MSEPEILTNDPYMNQRQHLRFVARETGIPVDTLQMSEDGTKIWIRATAEVLAMRKEDGYFQIVENHG